jgi:hypothetical protein
MNIFAMYAVTVSPSGNYTNPNAAISGQLEQLRG